MRYDLDRNIDQITADYRNGKTMQEIANKYEASCGAIRERINKHIPFHEIDEIKKRNIAKLSEKRMKHNKERSKTGYYRVHKQKCNQCKQGFIYMYAYYDEGRLRRISRTSLDELEIAVKDKGLEWIKY